MGRLMAGEWVASERVPAVSPQPLRAAISGGGAQADPHERALAQLQEKQAALAEAQRSCAR